MSNHDTIQKFESEVALKYQLYNSLFLSLPFTKIEKTGLLLSLFLNYCEEQLPNSRSASELVEAFFRLQVAHFTEEEKMSLLFSFIQYAERQVVLFDSIEDAAYTDINDLKGEGTLKSLHNKAFSKSTSQSKLDQFGISLVLTAHPTQFYPGTVLSIINDLSIVIKENDTNKINRLLKQLGKTAFINKVKPTPYDEAISLVWFLENVFYQAIGEIIVSNIEALPFLNPSVHTPIKMGFWPGGDRDGNPFVDAATTVKVAEALHIGILRCYYKDVRKLKRRLTFKGISNRIEELEADLYQGAYLGGTTKRNVDEILSLLHDIKTELNSHQDGLFVEMVEELIYKVNMFGLYFAFIDIRQDSSVHTALIIQLLKEKIDQNIDYEQLSQSDQTKVLKQLANSTAVSTQDDTLKFLAIDVERDVVGAMEAMRDIQSAYGHKACHRYIISHTENPIQVLEVLTLLKISAFKDKEVSIDIVPLFETVEDLTSAAAVMETLYKDETYLDHLKQRNRTQTIMVGFSDGTKDGGYLMANWGIYKAKEALTKVAKENDILVVFFDGRGGPPARGGGKTNQFYASQGNGIANNEIQLTIQGQTISSNFGHKAGAKFNIEQMFHAGITNILHEDKKSELTIKEEELITLLANHSFDSYMALRRHENFMVYLTEVSPLLQFSKTNIGSRPSKRGKSTKMTINDLRAIPFVASWNMIKQNVPGFFGLGTALQMLYNEGNMDNLQNLYHKSLFFRTLIDNSEMALYKSNLTLTAYLADHERYSEVYNFINDEYNLTVKNLLLLSGHDELMQKYTVEQLSIRTRERIILPLIAIQQYAINQLNPHLNPSATPTDDQQAILEKLIIRSSFGIINAGRNSA